MKSILTILFVLCLTCLGQENWCVPEASCRVRVTQASWDGVVFLPVRTAGCVVMTPSGRTVPSEVVAGEGVLASPPRKAPCLDFYLLDKESPKGGALPRVLRCSRGANVTTRALSAAEILRYFDEIAPPAFGEGCAEMGASAKPPFKADDKPHRLRLNRWETLVRLPEKSSLVFGARHVKSPWVILVDGSAVADWQTASRSEVCAGNAVEVQAGLHLVQMLSLQRAGEEWHGCLVKKGGEFKPVPALGPATLFSSIQVWRKDGKESVSKTWQILERRSFPETGGRYISVKDDDKTVYFPGNQLPALSIAGVVERSALQAFCPCQPAWVRVRIATPTSVLSHGQPAELAFEFDKVNIQQDPVVTRQGDCYHFSLGGQPVAKDLKINVVRPDDLSGLALPGPWLFQCQALPALSDCHAVPVEDVPGVCLEGDDLPVLKNVRRIAVPPFEGERRDVAQLRSLPLLLASKAPRAYLSGALFFQENHSIRESCLSLLFMAQACRSHGVEPVLVAQSRVPGATREESRLMALYCKEMGLSLKCGVVDLYSSDFRK